MPTSFFLNLKILINYFLEFSPKPFITNIDHQRYHNINCVIKWTQKHIYVVANKLKIVMFDLLISINVFTKKVIF